MSLLGYFWLLNSLSFIDGFITILGIKMGVLYEWNPIVSFFLNNFGPHGGMFIVKAGVLILSVVVFKLRQPDSNFVRNCYIALILFYSVVIIYTTTIILKASNV